MVQHPVFTRATAAAWRLRAQGLIEPFATLEQAAAALIGVQAQMLPAAALALALRVAQLTTAQVSAALYRERSLVRLWGQRHTLHLYDSRDWPLIYAANADQPTWFAREALRRGEDPADFEALMQRVADLMLQRGTLGRSDLRDAALGLPADYLNGWGGIFSELTRRGLACHGEPLREARMAHRRSWLPELAWHPPDSLSANLQLVRRFLQAFGPAEAADIALWRGRPLREVRAWLALLADELCGVTLDGRPAWLLRSDVERPAAAAAADLPALLLGRFDMLLLAYADKQSFLDAAHQTAVRRPAGHLEATMWQAGRVIGTWRADPAADGLRVILRPFRTAGRAQRLHFEQRAAQVAAAVSAQLAEVVWQDSVYDS